MVSDPDRSLKYHDVATFIGQESGSSYISADLPDKVSLTNTKLGLNYAREVYEVDTPGLISGSGIKPDYEIIPTVWDMLNNNDPVLDYTINMIVK